MGYWSSRLVLFPLVFTALLVAVAVGAVAAPQTQRPHWLVYVSGAPGEAQLYLIRSDGGARTRLTRGLGEAYSPVWSPDGQRLAFVREVERAAQVFVAAADGSAGRQVTRPPGSHASPFWSPDARTLAVVRTERDGRRSVYLVEAAGSTVRRLAAGYAPAWSPDGRHVAYLEATRGFPELFLLPPAGGIPRRMETPSGGVIPGVTGFAWSPDSRRIAYTSRSGPAQEGIHIVEVDGGTRKWLSTGYAPSWSPDGAHLAFTVSRVGSVHVAVIALNGSGGRALTDPRVISVRPAWSPDGRFIAFVSVRGGDTALYVIRADGRGERRLDQVYTDFSRGPLLGWRPR